jgi:membrane protease YdiL (CAAX protease family)
VRAGGSLATLYQAEMRTVLRDRRTVFAAIVLPLLVMPAMLLSAHWVKVRRESRSRDVVHLYALDASVALSRTWIDATRARLDAPGGKGNPAGLKLRQVETDDPARSLGRGDLHLVLLEERAGADDRPGGPGPAPDRAHGAGTNPRPELMEAAVPGVPRLVILYRADRSDSGRGAAAFLEALAATRRDHRQVLLTMRGSGLRGAQGIGVIEADLSSEGEAAGLALGRGLTALLLLVVLSAGAVAATDSIAGEKERGTLETLLTTAASRGEIVAAKHLAILTVAIGVTLIQVASFFVYVAFRLVPLPAGLPAAVPPAVAVLLLVLYLPVAALASAVLLLVSGFARSYKEAQLYFLPVFLIGLVPALAPFLPGIPLRSAILLVPVSNVAVAVKEVLVGSRDWAAMGAAWLVTAAAALLVSRAAARLLSRERLLAPASGGAASLARGPALFESHVTRWFAVMWAATLVVSLNAGGGDVRRELLFNLLVVFLAVPLAMLRIYRLDARSALALRLPRPAVWLAVAAGAPGGFLTGLALFRLASVWIPVPPALLESFGQALLPPGVPFWQMAALLTVLPAISEEIAFRGLLLYGLRRSLHPALLALAVAAVFALFHFALFRLVPTAFVGLLLVAVTLLTGSIFPAMAWHALNNALGLLLAGQGGSALDLDSRLLWAGPALLAAAFWIVWRSRTPYPGLRPWRRTGTRAPLPDRGREA